MPFPIERTSKAEEQLRDIILYRAELAGVDSALELLNRLEKGIGRLADFPDSGAPPRYSVLRSRGYRVLIVEKYLVFYKVDHRKQVVTIYAVVDGRRDYLNLI